MSDTFKTQTINVTARPRTSSSDSVATLSLKTPRTPRFAEATAIISPIEPPAAGRRAFARPLTNHFAPQRQPADLGFDEKQAPVEMEDVDLHRYPGGEMSPVSPLMSPPLKSALKTPGTSKPQIFSPTFHEEQALDKQEQETDKEQAKDIRVKTRVRMAKFLLRGVNFSCSLIVLSMLSATFSIFNATKSLPTRMINSSKFPPWAAGQQTWPQITILVISCISLAMSLAVFYAYWRGGHGRAEKATIYYTTFAVAVFFFSTVMWLLGAAVLHNSKATGNKQDMWGWSCNQNTRATLFQSEVNYALICRLQNWSLVCCIIEVIVEVITISIYGIVFYRYWSKRRLRKSMVNRDRARSDLYLAQLRSQSAPNTPGLNGPLSARGDYKSSYAYDEAPALEDGSSEGSRRYVNTPPHMVQPRPFKLQAPPIRVQGPTPKMQQTGFTPIQTSFPRTPSPQVSSRTPSPPQRTYSPPQPQSPQFQEHFGAAPGEQVYESVPIPGAYAHPSSPMSGHFPGQAR